MSKSIYSSLFIYFSIYSMKEKIYSKNIIQSFLLCMLFCNEKQHLNEMLSKLLMPLQYTHTRVGKSQSPAVPDKKGQGYSHACGKKCIVCGYALLFLGLLPLAWEK